MIVALYARVSTDDKGQDPQTQMDIIRQTAQARGYEVYGEYVDHASGKDPNRPQWKSVMELARLGRLDGIMALRVDRVMRSVTHLSTTIDNLALYKRADGNVGVALIFNDFELDPQNPNSKLVVNMLGAIAEWERSIISARTREGLAQRKKNGVVLGKKRRDDIPIHKIALMRLGGDSWNGISKTLNIPRTTLLDRRAEIESEVERCRITGDASDNMTDNGGVETPVTPLNIPSEGAN